MDLQADFSTEIILYKPIAYIKRYSFVHKLEIITLMKRNGLEYLERILFLDECEFQMFTTRSNLSPVTVIHHIL